MEINAEIKIKPDELLQGAQAAVGADTHGRAVLTVDGKPVASKEFEPADGSEVRFSEKIQLQPEEIALNKPARGQISGGIPQRSQAVQQHVSFKEKEGEPFRERERGYEQIQGVPPSARGQSHMKNADDRSVSPTAQSTPMHHREEARRHEEAQYERPIAYAQPVRHVPQTATPSKSARTLVKEETKVQTPGQAVGEFEKQARKSPLSPEEQPYISPEYQKSQHGLLTRAADALIGAERAVFDTLGSVVYGTKETVKGAGQAVADTVESGYDKTADALASGAHAVNQGASAVKEGAKQAGEAVIDTTKAVGNKISETGEAVRESIPGRPDIEGRIAESLKPAPGQLEKEFQGLKDTKHAIEDVGHGIADTTKQAGQRVADTTTAAGQAVKDTIVGAGDVAKSAGKAVVDTTKSAGGKVADTAKSTGEAVGDTAKAAGKGVVDTTQAVGEKISGTAKAAGSAVVDTSKATGRGVAEAAKGAAGAAEQARQGVMDTTKAAGDKVSDTAKQAGRATTDTARAAGEKTAEAGRKVKDSMPAMPDIEGRIAESLKPAPEVVREMHERPLGGAKEHLRTHGVERPEFATPHRGGEQRQKPETTTPMDVIGQKREILGDYSVRPLSEKEKKEYESLNRQRIENLPPSQHGEGVHLVHRREGPFPETGVKEQAERFEHHEKRPEETGLRPSAPVFHPRSENTQEAGRVGQEQISGFQQQDTVAAPKGEITVKKKVVEESQTVKPVSMSDQNEIESAKKIAQALAGEDEEGRRTLDAASNLTELGGIRLKRAIREGKTDITKNADGSLAFANPENPNDREIIYAKPPSDSVLFAAKEGRAPPRDH
ncbi:hypothetical protein QYM36_003755 [Artemia franciscana]|uniref:Uncharacterized protein n=1 Tax=Artemia franciscana TaxID=6661 RepID=A0AA88IGP5_ARTSF|nr:hypothetical protein QYM36_003755 [Artemia franciscana]